MRKHFRPRHLVELGSMPDAWKFANITPVFKKGLASDVRYDTIVCIGAVSGSRVLYPNFLLDS